MTAHGARPQHSFLLLSHTILLLALYACDSPPQPPLEIGFDAPVVETAADAWRDVPEWRLNEPPLVVIGDTLDPVNPTFWEGSDAALLSDGRIVFPANKTEQHYFAAEGTHLNTVGGAGDGPGEFRSASYIVRLSGDTTATWDGDHHSISFFSPGGQFIRAVTYPRSRQTYGGDLFGVLDNGRVVIPVFLSGAGRDGDGPGRDTLLVVGLDDHGNPVDTIGILQDQFWIRDAKAGTGYSHATGPSLAARGKRIYYTDGDRDEIRVYQGTNPLFLLRTLPPKGHEQPRIPDTSNGRLLVDDAGHLWVYNRGLAGRPDFLIYDPARQARSARHAARIDPREEMAQDAGRHRRRSRAHSRLHRAQHACGKGVPPQQVLTASF